MSDPLQVNIDGREVATRAPEFDVGTSKAFASDDLRVTLGLDPVGRRRADREVREELRDVKAKWSDLSARHVALLNAVRETAEATGVGYIGDDLIDVVGELGKRASRAGQLRGLVERWQGYADEMLKQRDDFARLLSRAQHDAAVHASKMGAKLRERNERIYELETRTRTLFKRRIGNAETGWLDVALEVKVENGQLVVCWWRRVGTDFKGWLRAW